MSVLPVTGYLSNAARTEGEMKTALEDVRDVVAELLGGSIETELTIATGSVTPTGAVHSIDTESDAASDDLANIVQTNQPDGRLLLIHANDGARDVVLKHSAGGAGQMILQGAADFTLDTTDKWVLFKRTGTNWEEIERFPAGEVAVAAHDVAVNVHGLPASVNVLGNRNAAGEFVQHATFDPVIPTAGTQTVHLSGALGNTTFPVAHSADPVLLPGATDDDIIQWHAFFNITSTTFNTRAIQLSAQTNAVLAGYMTIGT